jgi:hypothetical protein
LGLAASCAYAQQDQQEKQLQNLRERQKQAVTERQGQTGDMQANELWKQIARLHSQIVAMELKDGSSGVSGSARPGTANERGNDAPTAGRPAFGGSDTVSEQLWIQLAQVHKQIVAKQANEGERRTTLFRGDEQDRARQQNERTQPTDRDPSAARANIGQNESQLDPLWRQFVQLQQQIIAADIRKGGSAPSATGSAPSAASSDRGKSETRQDRSDD